MYEINERILELRKALDLTQTEFGERLHVSRGVINNIDRNLVEPKPLLIDNICVTFNVRREWLTDGEGEMFRELTREQKAAAFIGEALANKDDAFKAAVIDLLADLDAEDWANLRALLRKTKTQQNLKRILDATDPEG